MESSGIYVPYLFGVYIPEIGYKSFMQLYNRDCIFEGIKFILTQKYKNKRVTFYAHFGGSFDIYLIIKTIIQITGNNSFEYLKDQSNSIFYFKFDYNGYTFVFKDSYKIIPLSLNEIIKGFNISVNDFSGKLPFNHS
jgi:hypothetical protein